MASYLCSWSWKVSEVLYVFLMCWQQLDSLILSEAYDTHSLKKLHIIHGDLLKFRTKFSYSPLSTTTAGKQQVILSN